MKCSPSHTKGKTSQTGACLVHIQPIAGLAATNLKPRDSVCQTQWVVGRSYRVTQSRLQVAAHTFQTSLPTNHCSVWQGCGWLAGWLVTQTNKPCTTALRITQMSIAGNSIKKARQLLLCFVRAVWKPQHHPSSRNHLLLSSHITAAYIPCMYTPQTNAPPPRSAHINTGTQREPAVWHADACINRSSLQSIGLCWCWCVGSRCHGSRTSRQTKTRPRDSSRNRASDPVHKIVLLTLCPTRRISSGTTTQQGQQHSNRVSRSSFG